MKKTIIKSVFGIFTTALVLTTVLSINLNFTVKGSSFQAPQFSDNDLLAGTWSNQQAANVVIGQADFVTATGALGADRINLALSVTVDPTSGKVFVGDNNNRRVLRFSNLAAAINGQNAEAVLGAPDTVTAGSATTTQNNISRPFSLAIDASGRLWVLDNQNSRVLRFDNASSKPNGANADGVLGQTTFTGNTAGTTQSTMNFPEAVAIDSAGRLWVADRFNNRVLRFDNAAAKANGANADGVLGQINFGSSGSGTTQNTMNGPRDLRVDSSGRLWVADTSNNRVLRFDNAAAKADGANADGVLGQTNFTNSTAATTQNSMSGPQGVTTDAAGRLYVGDFVNNRVLIFDNAAALANGANANNELGQPNFTSGSTNAGLAAPTAQTLASPRMPFFDEPTQTLFVADRGNSRVLRYSIAPTTYADPAAFASTANCPGGNPCYSSIQAAINLVQVPGTVNVAGGAYSDNPTLSNNVTVNLTGNATLSAALTFSSGKINTGANILTLSCTGTTSGASSTNFVNGNVEKQFCSTGSFTFPVGETTGTAEYAPVTANVTALATNPSSLTVSTVDSSLPTLNPSTSLSRHWSLTETGDLTANLTFNYLPADVNGTQASYVVYRKTGAAAAVNACGGPSACTPGTNQISITNVSSFSLWSAGQLQSTASSVLVAGRVFSIDGLPVSRASVSLIDDTGNARSALTNQFGYYQLSGIPAGRTYLVMISAKGHQFTPQILTIDEDVKDLNFLVH